MPTARQLLTGAGVTSLAMAPMAVHVVRAAPAAAESAGGGVSPAFLMAPIANEQQHRVMVIAGMGALALVGIVLWRRRAMR